MKPNHWKLQGLGRMIEPFVIQVSIAIAMCIPTVGLEGYAQRPVAPGQSSRAETVQANSAKEEKWNEQTRLARQASRSSDPAKAEQLYRGVIDEVNSVAKVDSGAASIRLQSQNNLAGIYLRQNRLDDAARELAGIESEMAKIEQAPRRPAYLYNFACVLEAKGKSSEAFEKFRHAAELDPGLHSAAAGAFRVAWGNQSHEAGILQMAALVGQKVNSGSLVDAEQYLRKCLARASWITHPAYHKLVTSLVLYLKAASVYAPLFEKEWLVRLPQRIPQPAASRLQDIQVAYFHSLPVVQEVGSHEFFAAWRTDRGERKIFSEFLKMIGDGYNAQGNAKRALERYSHAWTLFTENMEAGLYLADLLSRQRMQLDPEGRILNRFVATVFESKGQAYLGHDWVNILRMHVILGTIFEQQEKWGDSYSAHSAIFQWEHALEARKKLGAKDANAPVPGLREKLARAYQKTNASRKAWTQYVQAAHEYVQLKRFEAGRNALGQAESLELQRSPADLQQLENLRKLIDEGRDNLPAGLTPRANAPESSSQRLGASSVTRPTTASPVVQVEQVLKGDPHLKGLPIVVTNREGIVTLEGTVKNISQRSEAEALALQVPGVRSVENRLVVQLRSW